MVNLSTNNCRENYFNIISTDSLTNVKCLK